MAATADQLAALAIDANFRQRIAALALQIAIGQIYVEDPNTPSHVNRLGFARMLIGGGGSGSLAAVIASSANLVASTITYDFTDGHVKTDATDAAISSQIASDWNMLAGV
jgi:hypothetical protein